MKVFRIEIDVTSTTWEECTARVEAETLEEAIEKFEDDPDAYDWQDWDHIDSEVRGWEVNEERCERWIDVITKEQDNDV
jgi:hypothetical protein